MDDEEFLTKRFEEHRPHLHAVSYRMLGSISEADHAVQEAWVRLNRSDTAVVDNLGGWLTTVVARICLNVLRLRESRREEPFGVHVPDPVVTGPGAADPEHEALLADSVGLALLVVLQTLTPAERLAFVLHDMFAVPFDEIAPMVDRTPTATRQLASRARRRVRGAARRRTSPASARSSTRSSPPRGRATSTGSSPRCTRTSSCAPTPARRPPPARSTAPRRWPGRRCCSPDSPVGGPRAGPRWSTAVSASCRCATAPCPRFSASPSSPARSSRSTSWPTPSASRGSTSRTSHEVIFGPLRPSSPPWPRRRPPPASCSSRRRRRCRRGGSAPTPCKARRLPRSTLPSRRCGAPSRGTHGRGADGPLRPRVTWRGDHRSQGGSRLLLAWATVTSWDADMQPPASPDGHANGVRTFRPRRLDGVVCLAGTTSSYAIDPYDEYVLAAVERGAMRATRRGRHYDAAVGDVLRWDPAGRHAGVALDAGSWRARLLLVELPTLRRWVLDEEEGQRPALAFGDPVVHRPDLAARLVDVHARLERDDDALGAHTAFLALVRDLLGGDAGRVDRVRVGAAVRVAREYLEEHLDRNVTLEELAAVCGVGRFRIVREFTAHVGVPPHRYLLARRLSRARRGLEQGADISELAAELGFVDQSHLHRHFRRAFATTPAAYRRAFQDR